MCLTKLTRSSKGQLSIEWMLLTVALIGVLGLTATVMQPILEKATQAENHFFEHEFITQLTQQCALLNYLGNETVLTIHGFSPQGWTIESDGNQIQLNEHTILCRTNQRMARQNLNGSFSIQLINNTQD